LAAAARGGAVVAGDTKVLPRGEGGGLYLATTGVGLRPPGVELGMHRIRPGDVVAVSGPIGDHGIAVLLAREEFEIRGDVRSDCGHVIDLARAAMTLDGLLHARPDPRRPAGVAGKSRGTPVSRCACGKPMCPCGLSADGVRDARLRSLLRPAGSGGGVVAAEQAQTTWRRRALPEGAGAALIGAIEAGRASCWRRQSPVSAFSTTSKKTRCRGFAENSNTRARQAGRHVRTMKPLIRKSACACAHIRHAAP
jgi:hydrogenase expression/formation protein HypE